MSQRTSIPNMDSMQLETKELLTYHCGCQGNLVTIATRYVADANCPIKPSYQIWTQYDSRQRCYKVKGIRLRLITLLAELAYNNLRHFRLCIFPSVICVSQLCLGFTLVLNCHIQKLGLDSRLPVVFDWFDRFILFWRNFKFSRSVPSYIPLICKSFEHF